MLFTALIFASLIFTTGRERYFQSKRLNTLDNNSHRCWYSQAPNSGMWIFLHVLSIGIFLTLPNFSADLNVIACSRSLCVAIYISCLIHVEKTCHITGVCPCTVTIQNEAQACLNCVLQKEAATVIEAGIDPITLAQGAHHYLSQNALKLSDRSLNRDVIYFTLEFNTICALAGLHITIPPVSPTATPTPIASTPVATPTASAPLTATTTISSGSATGSQSGGTSSGGSTAGSESGNTSSGGAGAGSGTTSGDSNSGNGGGASNSGPQAQNGGGNTSSSQRSAERRTAWNTAGLLMALAIVNQVL